MNKLKVGILLLVFTLILSSVCFAKDNMQNVVLNGNNLSWNAFNGADYYKVDIGERGYVTTTATFLNDIDSYAEQFGMTTGDHTIGLTAMQKVGSEINVDNDTKLSNTWTTQWHYTAAHDQLATPDGLAWDGLKATWNAVPNAEMYHVWLFELDTSTTPNTYRQKGDIVDTPNNYYNFAGDSRIVYGKTYKFTLYATATGYPDSDYNRTGSEGYYAVNEEYDQLATPQNPRWDGMIARWDAVPNAETYTLFVHKDGKYLFHYGEIDENYFDLSDEEDIVGGHIYTIYVFAEAPGYPESEASDYASKFIPVDGSFTASLNGDVLSWNRRGQVFVVSIGEYSIQVTNMYEYNMFDLAMATGYDDGEYDISVVCYETAEIWQGTYVYDAPNPKLAAPTNPHWEGKVAKWNTVTNAESYIVYLFIAPDLVSTYSIPTSGDNFYDFSNDPRLQSGHEYFFAVKAIAKEYPTSDASQISSTIKIGSKGDLNGDTRITVEDIRLLIQAYIHPEQIDDLDIMDMDGDGAITVADIRLLIQEYVK